MRLRETRAKDMTTDINRGAGAKRLQPSEPLHMTTRGAASRTGSVATNSRQASAAAEDAPEDALSELSRKIGGADFDSERPAKRIKRSEDGSDEDDYAASVKPDPDAAGTVLADDAEDEDEDEEEEDLDKANNETASRSQSSAENGADTGDFATALNEALSNTAQQSIEETSAPISNRGGRRRGKRRGRWWRRRTLAAEGIERTPFDSPSHVGRNKISENRTPEKPEPGDIIKRLPGRRRAPHSDPLVEADLRRQLELKVAYRAVVKALKPVLAELAERTSRELSENPALHEDYEEFDEITSELDARLARRLSILEGRFREEDARMEREKYAQEHIIKGECQRAVEDARKDYELRSMNRFMSILRDIEKNEDSEATDDEDGIIPNLYGIRVSDNERVVLDDAYDSRSRFFIETERMFENYNERTRFKHWQRMFDEQSLIRRPKRFAVYDGDLRQKSSAILNLHTLAEAGEEVEEAADIAEKEAADAATAGIQLLVTASDMKASALEVKEHSKAKQTVKDIRTPQRETSQSTTIAHSTPATTNSFQSVAPSSQGTSMQTFAPPSSNAPPNASSAALQSLFSLTQESGGRPGLPGEQRHDGRDIRPLLPHVTEMSMQPMSNGIGFGAHTAASPSSDYFTQERSGNMQSSHPPLTVETSNLSSRATSPSPRTPSAAPKQRKRPGPRAHYSFQTEPKGIVHTQGGQTWSPFNNALGPPTGLPRYMKESEQTKRPSSPTTPMMTSPQSSEDQRAQPWSEAPSHHRTGSFDQLPRANSIFQAIAPANSSSTTYPSGNSVPVIQYVPPGSNAPPGPQRQSTANASAPPKHVPAFQINPFIPSPQTSIFQHNPFLHNPPQPPSAKSTNTPSHGSSTAPGPQSFVWSSTQPPSRAYPAPTPSHSAAQRFPTYAPPLPTLQPAHSPPPAPQPASHARHPPTPTQSGPPHPPPVHSLGPPPPHSSSQQQQHQKILPRQPSTGGLHQVILPKPSFAQPRGPAFHTYALGTRTPSQSPGQQSQSQGGPTFFQQQGSPTQGHSSPTSGHGAPSMSSHGGGGAYGNGHGQGKNEKKPREIRFENFTPRQ